MINDVVLDENLTLDQVIQTYDLEVLNMADSPDEITIKQPYVSRCGMPLMGFLNFHNAERIQIMGKLEVEFLESLSLEDRRKNIENFLHMKMPAIIITRDADCDDILLELVKKHKVPLLRTSMRPSRFIADFYFYVSQHLAPIQTIHGVLIEVHGEGVLILGSSGIGKSETAVELVKRGHRLVADDRVIIKLDPKMQLVGSAPEIIRHFIEIRGIGIVNVMTLFGAEAVLNQSTINAVVMLEPWEDGKSYERLGLDDKYENILGVNIPLSVIPVKPGRNLAVIIEVVAINNRVKRNGYNSAEDLDNRLIEHINNKNKKEE